MITKKILIFGASGQVGRYCIRRLVKNNYKITAVTRNLHKKGYILKTQAPIGYLDIVQANIFDEKELDQLLSEVDICINLILLRIFTQFSQKNLLRYVNQKKLNFYICQPLE